MARISEKRHSRGEHRRTDCQKAPETEHKRVARAVVLPPKRLRHLVSTSPAINYICDPSGDYGAAFVSTNVTSQLGYNPQQFIEDSKFWISHIHPEDAPRVLGELESLFEQNHQVNEYRFRHKDGTYRWMQDRVVVVREATGQPREIVGCMIDVTESKQAEAALRKSEAKNRALVEAVPDMMFRVSKDFTILDWKAAKGIEPLVPPAEFLGKRIPEVLPPEVAEGLMQHVRQALETGDTQNYDYHLVKNGEMRYYEARLATSGEEEILAIVRDISERKKLEEELRVLSTRDPLTGLFNRRYMEESMERELRRAQRKKRPLALIMIDIDNFKRLNDTFGHQVGDTVLRSFGDFLQNHIRAEDIACRYGGEEFALILPEAPVEVGWSRAQQLRVEVRGLEMRHDDQSLEALSLSAGVAGFPEHGSTCDSIFRVADTALYRAKREGRDRVIFGEASDLP